MSLFVYHDNVRGKVSSLFHGRMV